MTDDKPSIYDLVVASARVTLHGCKVCGGKGKVDAKCPLGFEGDGGCPACSPLRRLIKQHDGPLTSITVTTAASAGGGNPYTHGGKSAFR